MLTLLNPLFINCFCNDLEEVMVDSYCRNLLIRDQTFISLQEGLTENIRFQPPNTLINMQPFASLVTIDKDASTLCKALVPSTRAAIRRVANMCKKSHLAVSVRKQQRIPLPNAA